MTTRIIVFLALILGLAACGTVQPSAGGAATGYGSGMTAGYADPAMSQVVYPAQIGPKGRWVVNTGAPMSAFALNSGAAPGTHPAFLEPDGRWNIAGFVQANPPTLVGGGAPVPTAASMPVAAYQPQTGATAQLAIQALSGLRPDQARAMRIRLEATRAQACDGTRGTTIGALIGAVIGNLLTGDGFGTAAGAFIGLAGGHADAQASCQNWQDMYQALLAVEAQSRCTVKTAQSYSSMNRTNEVAGTVECQDITPYAATVTPPQIPTYRPGQQTPVPAAVVKPAKPTTPTTPANMPVVSGPERPPK